MESFFLFLDRKKKVFKFRTAPSTSKLVVTQNPQQTLPKPTNEPSSSSNTTATRIQKQLDSLNVEDLLLVLQAIDYEETGLVNREDFIQALLSLGCNLDVDSIENLAKRFSER